MSKNIKLAQSRSQGEIIDDSVTFLKQNLLPLFKSYFAICGLFWLTGIVLAVFSQTQTFQLQEQEESIYTFSYFATILFTYINNILGITTTLCFIKFYVDKGNETPTVTEVWDYVKYYFLKVFGTTILLSLFAALGFFMCIIPGIYLTPVVWLMITIMVMENETPSNSFNQSFRLIKNDWWNVTGVLVVSTIIIVSCMVLLLIPVVIVVGAILYLTDAPRGHVVSMAATASWHALQFLFVFPVISLVISYYNLNEKFDDHGLMQRIAMIGKKPEATDEQTAEDY
jgi:hypothetical protein